MLPLHFPQMLRQGMTNSSWLDGYQLVYLFFFPFFWHENHNDAGVTSISISQVSRLKKKKKRIVSYVIVYVLCYMLMFCGVVTLREPTANRTAPC